MNGFFIYSVPVAEKARSALTAAGGIDSRYARLDHAPSLHYIETSNSAISVFIAASSGSMLTSELLIG